MPATATLERPTGLTLDQSVTLDELVTMVGATPSGWPSSSRAATRPCCATG